MRFLRRAASPRPFAAHEGEQPVAKGAAGRVVIQPAHRADNGAEDVLRKVGGVGVLQALFARIAVHEGRVRVPRTLSRRPHPASRAGAGAGWHGWQGSRPSVLTATPSPSSSAILATATRADAAFSPAPADEGSIRDARPRFGEPTPGRSRRTAYDLSRRPSHRCSPRKPPMRPLVGIAGLIVLAPASLSAAEPGPAQGQPLVSPEVHADGKVTFRLAAPRADKVVLNSGEMQPTLKSASTPLAKGDDGIWSRHRRPAAAGHLRLHLQPRRRGHDRPVQHQRLRQSQGQPGLRRGSRPQRATAHRRVARRSARDRLHPLVRLHAPAAAGAGSTSTRRPAMARTPQRKYPVLYLLHGSGDNDSHWMLIGRANVIADNLLADGKAVPMLIVMPDGHVRERPAGPATRRPGRISPAPSRRTCWRTSSRWSSPATGSGRTLRGGPLPVCRWAARSP